ncbi:MAG TPA: hypothetical protein VNU64_19785 [Burkholderiales bacterium]|nr:hypothetical protein [Burkholderiales bacterium]
MNPFKSSHAAQWTEERLGRLTTQELKQLRENAERLNETALVELCSEALVGKRATRKPARAKTHARRLVARTRAFEARGVHLADPRTSWGGVRKADGAIVLGLWAANVVSRDGSCRYLLWAPNAGGARPWSDSAGGVERLAHCRAALERGSAEGLLVYGDALEGYLPEDKAHAILGVDAEVVIELAVEQVGDEYWAVWGRKKPQ